MHFRNSVKKKIEYITAAMRFELEAADHLIGLAIEAEELVAVSVIVWRMVFRKLMHSTRLSARRTLENTKQPDAVAAVDRLLVDARPVWARSSPQMIIEHTMKTTLPVGRQRLELLAEELLEPLQMEVLAQHVCREEQCLLERVVFVELLGNRFGLRHLPAAVRRICTRCGADELKHRHRLRETFEGVRPETLEAVFC